MITLNDIKKARDRVGVLANRTYLDKSATFSKISGNEIYLKPENLQKTGAFKLRGAANYILNMKAEGARVGGVITSSSGNHGQAVAYAAAYAGLPAVVVVPDYVSAAKVAAMQSYGAEVVYGDGLSTKRAALARKLARERDLVFISPYDDPYIMAGQGTVGLEILEDLPDVDAVAVQIGGGGLIAGIATAIKESKPHIKVFGVEPKGSNSMYLSRKEGKRSELSVIETIADGLKTNIPGELTFPVVQKYVDDILLVADEEIEDALFNLLERGKLLAETSGATSLAAVLSGKLTLRDKKIAVIISGGNINLQQVAEIINKKK